jgi:hypothetical protein
MRSGALNLHPVAKPLPTPPQQNQCSERQRNASAAVSWSAQTPSNSNPGYAYRVESAFLFGSILSDAERLGDVDVAIELLSKVAEEAELRKWCDRRRHVAREQGESFSSTWTGSSGAGRRVFKRSGRGPEPLACTVSMSFAEMVNVQYRLLRRNYARVLESFVRLSHHRRPCVRRHTDLGLPMISGKRLV